MPPRPILRVGLTGGIASGKTTVAAMLAAHGAYVVDADVIAHEVVARGGPAFRDVVSRFGEGVVGPDGQIDRPALGRIVFSDADARRDLEAIVHPLILREIDRRIARYLAVGHATTAIVDAALLVETGLHEDLDRLIVVVCSRETQMRRLLARGGVTETEASARIDVQGSVASKRAVADYVVDTDTTLRETRAQVDRIWAALVADFEALYGGWEP